MNKGEIIIYETKDGETSIDVRMEEETVWLTLNQMCNLFDRDKSVVSRHIRNIYKEGELELNSTVAKNATVQKEGNREVLREIEYYNLDVIISVGYRVKSQRGTQFRIWANSVLKRYLTQGFAIKENATQIQLQNLSSMLEILSKSIENKSVSVDETQNLLRIIKDFSYGLDTLDKYDNQVLEVEKTTDKEDEFRINYENASQVIQDLKKKFNASQLFGNEKDSSFKSSVNTIYQTFDGKELYPSIEEKAAMFLYLVVKNHSFSDGNKRIAAFLFLWFLEKNKILYKKNGQKLIENNTLVALTLMIAESKSEEKDMMQKVIVNLINKNN
ncbi:cytochrome c [Cloacibacterium rupense]|uniref:Cytochrome c n=1 Tax=Cloacibacterium rupense TaxID=517423 RepID=A0ABQ2NPA0_9FLAO|nr:RhuM family protein [Cloacibacterium rupense]GGP06198.1 cytochrome c [Cloacibacterium rupense]